VLDFLQIDVALVGQEGHLISVEVLPSFILIAEKENAFEDGLR
jgi:hypothetical protein